MVAILLLVLLEGLLVQRRGSRRPAFSCSNCCSEETWLGGVLGIMLGTNANVSASKMPKPSSVIISIVAGKVCLFDMVIVDYCRKRVVVKEITVLWWSPTTLCCKSIPPTWRRSLWWKQNQKIRLLRRQQELREFAKGQGHDPSRIRDSKIFAIWELCWELCWELYWELRWTPHGGCLQSTKIRWTQEDNHVVLIFLNGMHTHNTESAFKWSNSNKVTMVANKTCMMDWTKISTTETQIFAKMMIVFWTLEKGKHAASTTFLSAVFNFNSCTGQSCPGSDSFLKAQAGIVSSSGVQIGDSANTMIVSASFSGL